MSLSKLLFSTEGRIPRSTYWYYSLGYTGTYLLALFLDYIFGTFDESSGYGLFSALLSLVGIVTGLAVGIKRCHDRDHSGWFLLLGLIPFLNIWVGIELAFLKGTDGNNKYGADPLQKAIDKATETNQLGLVMESGMDWMKQLDAAEALARKNDRRGLDYLNASLENSNPDVREVAKEILAGLISDGSGVSHEIEPKIAHPTKIKTLTPEEIEIRRKRKNAKMIYRQKILKVKGRCVICGEKLGIIDKLKGEIYCTQHKATQ
jgi:uncharacterized membrane protein YhaH (DUF805 family)